MQRYFLKTKNNEELIFHEQDLHHIKNVMRNKPLDLIEAVWNNTIYLCQINSLEPFSISIIDKNQEDRDLDINLTIAISLVQEQKFDLILQKLTELGVSKIIPIKTERSIVKIDESKLSKKYQRWQTICKEASEQSKRTNIPEIGNILTLREIAEINCKSKFICSLTDETKPLDEYLNENLKDALFIIGPEGGFSKQEETFLINNSFKPITLGKRVLRVETAAIYVASIINYIYGK